MEEKDKNLTEQEPEKKYAAPEIDDDDDDDAPTEWVPSRFEKRVHAIPEDKWKLYQILGGGAIGLFTVAALFLGGTGKAGSALFLVAVVLALLLPNWLEDRGRRKLNLARYAMIAVIAVGVVALLLYTGLTQGWDFFKKKDEAEAALKLLRI